MKVCVRLFAGLRDAVGERTIDFELRDGSTVQELKQRLAEDYPATRPMLATLVCAIDDEYVSFDERLREGAEVALIPPVSGGAELVSIAREWRGAQPLARGAWGVSPQSSLSSRAEQRDSDAQPARDDICEAFGD